MKLRNAIACSPPRAWRCSRCKPTPTWKTIPGTSRDVERSGTGFAKRWRTLQDEKYGEESVCDLAKSRPELRGPVDNYRRTSSFKLGKSGSLTGLASER